MYGVDTSGKKGMFVDRVEIEVAAGDGGDGVIAWRREKYIPKGGPSGGDGGKGGSVLVYVDPNSCGLEWFRHVRRVGAKSGEKGGGSCRKGGNGEDVVLKVPPGTVLRDIVTGDVLFDGVKEHETFTLCRGGKGGYGNDHFKSPTHRAPQVATNGEAGEKKSVEFELKLIADVGLVGFPNAGKSTLLSKLACRDVEIGAYPFTTLTPNLGYISYEGGKRVVLSDIPGIIEGAHKNRGLGLEFLRHIERTKVLLFVLDAGGVEGRTPVDDFEVLRHELMHYNPALLERPSCCVLNKCDEEGSEELVKDFKERVEHSYIIEVSATEGTGLEDLKAIVGALALR